MAGAGDTSGSEKDIDGDDEKVTHEVEAKETV